MRNLILIMTLPTLLSLPVMSCKKGQDKNLIQNPLPDTSGPILYVGTYTEKESHVDGKATGIYVYQLEMATGRLYYISTSPETTNPSYIDVDPAGRCLYAVNETGASQGQPSGTISAYRLAMKGKELEFIDTVSSCGNYPCYLQVERSGKYVMTANYGSGTVALLPIRPDGSLGNALSVDRHTGKGPSPNQEAAHAHMITMPESSPFVYSCDLGTDHIYIYKLDAIGDRLLAAGDPYATRPGAGPRHLAWHPFKSLAYVVNELNGTIECMRVDTLTGGLSRFQVISTLAEGDSLDAACADIHITPSGKYLYASNRGQFNNIAMYTIHPQTGELSLIGHQPTKGEIPRNFIIDPTGTYLLVANQNSNNVVTFRIDQRTGKLIDIGVETTIPTPVCLKFLP